MKGSYERGFCTHRDGERSKGGLSQCTHRTHAACDPTALHKFAHGQQKNNNARLIHDEENAKTERYTTIFWNALDMTVTSLPPLGTVTAASPEQQSSFEHR